ncbi:MAG: BtpA/SgcQ family protein [Breznakia sp.]
MNKKDRIKKLLNEKKVVFAMLHLKGENSEEILEIAIKEAHSLYDNGVDGVIIENYFGDYSDMERVLQYFQIHFRDKIYGVNALDNDKLGFELTRKYGASFLQLDSVSGHLDAKEEPAFIDMIQTEREKTDAFLFGGVRFKYQPYKSGRTLKDDLLLGMNRCDGIVVTGNATGDETPLQKLKEFRDVCGNNFPLLIGSGSNPNNILSLFNFSQGAIVGSYFKDSYKDTGDVNGEHVKKFMSVII